MDQRARTPPPGDPGSSTTSRIRIGSLAVALSGAATFAAVLASYSAFRPVRDALILGGNPDQIPWLFLGTFVAISIVSPVWSAVLARWSRRRVLPVAYHAFAACLVAFFVIVRAEIAPVAVGRVFYIWSAVFNLFVVSVLWSLLADLLGPSTARRVYGPIAAGGTVGTFVGPLLTRLLVDAIGVAGVLLMSALLLELAVVGLHLVRRAARQLPHDEAFEPAGDPDEPAGGGALTGIARVARSPYLVAIVGYVLCTAFAATFIYLRQERLVHDLIAGGNNRTRYFSSVDLWVSPVTLVLQILVARPALGRLGPGAVLAVLPVVQLIGLAALVFEPSLTTLAVVLVIGRAATHGLTRPARELLFTVVSRDDKYRAKNAIDTIAYRFGDVASGWLNTALIAIGGSIALVCAAIPLAAIWLGLAAVLGHGFRRRVTKEIS
ncbi:MAG TPA: MFS transporter [Kofleriaceae bacterium]|nr:MFS transporter [Kofleriaceae bacterium]